MQARGVGVSEDDSNNTLLLCLRLMRMALESCGGVIGSSAPFFRIISDDFFKHLLMLALRPSAPQPILSEILRIFSFFAATTRVELKLQLEVFFERLVFAALGGGRKDSPLVPLVLDTLTDLSYDSSFLVDLYVNYDCDPQRSDLMETLYKLVGLRGCCEVALGAGVGRRGGVDAGRAGAAHHVQRHQVHRQPHRREAGGAAARHRRRR